MTPLNILLLKDINLNYIPSLIKLIIAL